MTKDEYRDIIDKKVYRLDAILDEVVLIDRFDVISAYLGDKALFQFDDYIELIEFLRVQAKKGIHFEFESAWDSGLGHMNFSWKSKFSEVWLQSDYGEIPTELLGDCKLTKNVNTEERYSIVCQVQ